MHFQFQLNCFVNYESNRNRMSEAVKRYSKASERMVKVLNVFCTFPGIERCVEWTQEKIICINNQQRSIRIIECEVNANSWKQSFCSAVMTILAFNMFLLHTSISLFHSLVSFHYLSSSSSPKVLRIFIRHSTQPVSHQFWNALSDGLHEPTRRSVVHDLIPY